MRELLNPLFDFVHSEHAHRETGVANEFQSQPKHIKHVASQTFKGIHEQRMKFHTIVNLITI